MSEAPRSVSGADENVAAASREAFAAWVDEEPDGRIFGQVLIRPAPPVGYYLLHVEDAQATSLELRDDPRVAQEIAKLTDSGEYRPLKSSPNLRQGWELRVEEARGLFTAMNYLYPAAIVHWYLEREGRLEVTSYRENAARQSGIYGRIKHLSDEGVQNAARACCGGRVCLKRTLWDVDDGTPLGMDRGEGEIPCPEPCSLFVSFARRVRMFERETENAVDRSGFTPSEKEDLASLVEAGAGGRVELAREAEFEAPLNERRLRYRRITLVPKLRAGE